MKLSEKIRLFPSQFDLNDRIKPTAIFSIFQDIASEHGENMGVGFKPMLDKHLYWIISRVKYDVLSEPKEFQEVIVETWPHEKGRVDFDRDYLIKDIEGNVLVKGTSKWCVINTETRKLEFPSEVNYPGQAIPDVNYQERFVKTPSIEREGSPVFSHTVGFSEIDHNKHLNNVNYATYVFDALKKEDITHLQLNFIAECKLGERIDVFTKVQEDGSFLVSGYVDDDIKFSALVK